MVNSDLECFPQGLKKTSVTMDQERPRSDLSINSRNDLRKVLHLEFLYKENKVHAFQVWWGVLEWILAMSGYSRALPGHQRPVARGLPHRRLGRNRQIPTVCWVSSFCLPHPTVRARKHRMGLIFAPRPEPVNNYSLCSFLSRETIFSKTVLKNIAFSYAKIFHSLPPEEGVVFLLQLGVIHLIQADGGFGFS